MNGIGDDLLEKKTNDENWILHNKLIIILSKLYNSGLN